MPMDPKTLLGGVLIGATMLSAAMLGAWWLQRRTNNTGWIDVIWSFSLGGVTLLAVLAPLAGPEAAQPRQLFVASLVGLWSLRLGWHILLRTRAIGDDPRYRNRMRQWGDVADRQLFWHVQIQAAVSLLLCLTVVLAARNPYPNLRPQDIIGGLILSTAILGEAVADYQLRQWKLTRGNKSVCDVGLWRLSRHPNYFF